MATKHRGLALHALLVQTSSVLSSTIGLKIIYS